MGAIPSAVGLLVLVVEDRSSKQQQHEDTHKLYVSLFIILVHTIYLCIEDMSLIVLYFAIFSVSLLTHNHMWSYNTLGKTVHIQLSKCKISNPKAKSEAPLFNTKSISSAISLFFQCPLSV